MGRPGAADAGLRPARLAARVGPISCLGREQAARFEERTVAGAGFPEQPPIPGYEPVRPLGINLAAVYLARHTSSGTLVALRVWRIEKRRYASFQELLDQLESFESS